MSTLPIVCQEKGGVYKTYIAVHLTEFLKGRGHDFRPVDFDKTAGLLTRVFPPPASAVVIPDPDQIRAGTSLLKALMQRVLDGSRVLVDCGANTGPGWEALFDVWPELPNLLKEAGVNITLIVPVSNSDKTVESFYLYQKLFPESKQILVAVRAYEGETIKLPKHPADLTCDLPIPPARLFSAYATLGLSIDAIAVSELPALRFDRGLACNYLPLLHDAFQKIEPHILS